MIVVVVVSVAFAEAALATMELNGEPSAPVVGRPSSADEARIYTNQFVIQVVGGEREARRLAKRHGFNYLNHVVGDYYHLEHRRLSKRSIEGSPNATLPGNIALIEDEPQVSYWLFALLLSCGSEPHSFWFWFER